MEPVTYLQYLILSVLLIAWCILHSAMISVSVTEYLGHRLGLYFRFYRLFFNIVSVLTLIPVYFYASSLRTKPIFLWEGYGLIVWAFLWGTAFLLFFLGASRYDMGQFLGLRQIREGTTNPGIADWGDFSASGILGIIRHPWYLASMLPIWARHLDCSAILENIILPFYLVTGTYLEEKKIDQGIRGRI